MTGLVKASKGGSTWESESDEGLWGIPVLVFFEEVANVLPSVELEEGDDLSE